MFNTNQILIKVNGHECRILLGDDHVKIFCVIKLSLFVIM